MSGWSRAPVLVVLAIAFFPHSSAQVLYQDQEIEVHDLPTLTARSHDPADVLVASLDTVFHDREICCGRDSALEDAVAAADPKSLKDIAAKIGGRHLLSDGRPITIQATYLAPENVRSADPLANMMQDHHAPLILWNSHLYVVDGMDYRRTADENGGIMVYIHKLLLWDTRYSDSRRNVVFDRTTEDPATVQGLLFLQVQPGASN